MVSKSLLFRLDGHEVVPVNNVFEWCEWMDFGELTVDYTSVGGGVGVSTVFLGLAAPRITDGPPLLFETAIMRETVPECVERYATWDEAEKGHAKWTKAAREGRTAKPQASSTS
jgi:hypothetical protein